MLKKPKEKGRRFELQLVEILKDAGFKDASRSPLSGQLDRFPGDVNSDMFPMHIEAKNQETTRFLEWYQKAESEASKPAVVVWTKNYEDVYCFMKFSHLIEILKRAPVAGVPRVETKSRGKKLTLDETSGLPFSKSWQTRHHRKKKKRSRA